ncbi:MAG: hypothetical protein GTN97_03350 [Nitrosopumilaceae archaeon]|nr:hypothetical protein [Nitrosopumilaceae archaeon]
MVNGKKKRKRPDRVTDFDLAHAIHRSRSQHAQDVDEGTLARLTTNINLFAFDPSRFDFAGVDTPTGRREPKQFNMKRALAKAKREGLI